MEFDNKKPFKVKDITRNIKKALVVGSLEEIRYKVAEKFNRSNELPTIHLDSDGTEIDDEEYFRTLDPNTELIAVFPGEHWIDPSHYVTLSNYPEDQLDASDKAAKTARIKQLMGQLQNNLCNVSVLSDPDLETLSNMDPNSLVDITGKDFMEQLKDLGRPLCTKRNAQDRINLLKLLKDGAIFCSERYPEDAEAIDMEIRRQLKDDVITTATTAAITTITATDIIQTHYTNTKPAATREFNNSTIATTGLEATEAESEIANATITTEEMMDMAIVNETTMINQAKTIDLVQNAQQQQQQQQNQYHHQHQIHQKHHQQQQQGQQQRQQPVTIVVEDTSEMMTIMPTTAAASAATVTVTVTDTDTAQAIDTASPSPLSSLSSARAEKAAAAAAAAAVGTTITTSNTGNTKVHDI